MIKDYEKRKQYAREWIAERRHKWFSDKSCVRCGSLSDLELDHIDNPDAIMYRLNNGINLIPTDDDINDLRIHCGLK